MKLKQLIYLIYVYVCMHQGRDAYIHIYVHMCKHIQLYRKMDSDTVQKLGRYGSDSAESESKRPSPFRDQSTRQPIVLFCLTRARLGRVIRVEEESAPSQGGLARVSRVEAELASSQAKISYN